MVVPEEFRIKDVRSLKEVKCGRRMTWASGGFLVTVT